MNIHSIIEFFTVFLYIYFLILLGIFIKPTFITKSVLLIYCIVTTFNILILCNFFSNNIKAKYSITFLLTIIYSLFCVFCYVLFHKIYHKYIKKNIMFKTILIILPVLYLFNIKFIEYFFQCHEYHIVSWGIDFCLKRFISLLNIIIKT